MIKNLLFKLSALAAMLLIVFGQTSFVYAQDGTPPDPTVVTSRVAQLQGIGRIHPDSVYNGPNNNSVTITNEYYPYYGGAVKSDGWANTNFYLMSSYRVECQSDVKNNAGQQAPQTSSHGNYGGNNCPTTPQSVLSGGVVPSTYTSWTDSQWHWSDGSYGSGTCSQSHYQA